MLGETGPPCATQSPPGNVAIGLGAHMKMHEDLVKALEQALQDREGKLSQVIEAFDSLESGVVLYGPDDRIVFCNRRFREIYSQVADLLVPGTPYADIARAFYRRGFESRTQLDEETYVRSRVEKHSYPDEGDYEFLLGDDTWLLVSDRKISGGGVIGFRLDITRRKKAEQALFESEQRFKSLLEMTSDWYWEQDKDFRFTHMSEGHLTRIGVQEDKRLGRTRWELDFLDITPEQWEAHKSDLEAHKPFRNFEYRWLDANGREFYISVSGDPVFDANGEFSGYRGVGTDITQRKQYEARIKELAENDFLTGLPNRALVNARFEYAARQARRAQRLIGLLFIDLDRFKNINDSLGHHVGDSLLAETGQRLQRLVRATDTVSRHGGDEFLILLSDLTDPANAGRIATQAIAEIARPFHIVGHDLIVTPSIGIAMWPNDGEDLGALIRKADVAMYHSKTMGRNQYSFFREEMNTRVHERLALENALRGAAGRHEFFLHYQPIFNLATRTIVSAEALLRWRHPDLGLVPPGRFISIAEESGLIVGISEWVMREVCRAKPCGRSAGAGRVPITINLSAIQFRGRRLIEILPQLMKESALDAKSIEIEITESVLMSESEVASGVLEELHAHGMRLVIDDFGTGYSNLAYLKRFDIYKLKIDQSFIRDITLDPNDAALTRGIIGLAKSLGLKVVAEGVETQAQLDFLIENGCDEAQGFLLCPPVEHEELLRLLDAQKAA
jgi:diguanylate cyclase (GGDEF)-like protein/PAS domain S-box-containing protein